MGLRSIDRSIDSLGLLPAYLTDWLTKVTIQASSPLPGFGLNLPCIVAGEYCVSCSCCEFARGSAFRRPDPNRQTKSNEAKHPGGSAPPIED